jgi:N-acetylmuramoyl-L-alanine amidase
MKRVKLLLTKNDCYKSGAKLTPRGIVVHSTGANNPTLRRYIGPDDGLLGKNTGGNDWNRPKPDGKSKCVHAFIGLLGDGKTVATYQTLPWDMKGWHGGSGAKGSVNDTHIGFEICEDGLADPVYLGKVYQEAVELCAFLCGLYKLDPTADGVIIGHYEGNARGIASNHADPGHWFPKHGRSMDGFRADVKKALQGGTQAPASPPAPAPDVLKLAVKHAAPIIFSNEGSYGSINSNDNGAMSIGKVQWHGPRALALLKTIVSKNITEAKRILGDVLLNEIQRAGVSSWNMRTAAKEEAAKISALLITSQGIAAQDALAESDITAYVKKGMSYGLTDCGALIFFADGVNQFGENSEPWKNIALKALKGKGDVSAMLEAAKSILSSAYIARRESVCKAVLALKLGGGTNTQPSTFAPSVPYAVRVTDPALNIRSGPGASYLKVGCIQDKGVYTIVEVITASDGSKWGKLKSGAGWINLFYTKAI